MAIPTRNSKRRQTRLNYQPLPASSPQTSQHYSDVDGRAAAVPLHGEATATKKRIIEIEGPPSSPPFARMPDKQESKDAIALPTPQATSELSESNATDENFATEELYITSSRGRIASRRAILVSDSEDDATDCFDLEVQEPPHNTSSHNGGSEDEDEENVRSPMSRRAHRQPTAVPQKSEPDHHEEHELADDVNDLESNILQETRTRPNPGSKRRIKHMNQLEILKARRGAKRRGEEPQFPEMLEANSAEEAVRDPFVSDEDDEGFLSDNDDLESASSQLQDVIPLHSISSPEEAFELVIEWLVYKRLVPNFDDNAERYRTALRKLDDQAATLAASKFSSSAWRPDFYRVLNARPHFNDKCTGISAAYSCQACGRSSHPATWYVRFTGAVYNQNTLEPIDDDDEESRDYDIDGNPIVGEEYRFSLGSHCRTNAVYAHSLKHWRYHLNARVLDHLAGQGILEAAQLAVRESWSDERRATLAEVTLEEMKADQSMDQLWVEFRDRIEQAESTKMPGSGRQFISE